MFNYKNMIQRAIEFFPLWTDIRKRYNKSQGGKFLSSIIEEEIKTEETIQEYIDSYFLYTYVGHEDEVMDYVYMTTVGHLPSLVDVKIYYDGKLYPYAKNVSEQKAILQTDGNVKPCGTDNKISLQKEFATRCLILPRQFLRLEGLH